MALRKFAFINTTDGGYGFVEEQAASDELSIGKLTLAGVSGVALDGGDARASNFGTPTADDDLATKGYVDSVAQGLEVKASVLAATTGALPACTYSNGTGGVGATLTADANGALPAQDGITLAVGNRLLVKNQSAGLQHGIYTVTTVGDAGTQWVLTRATDYDNSPAGEVSDGNFFFVEQGSTLADSGWVMTTNGAITIGTTAMTFSQFSGAGSYTAGAGLTLTGSTFAVGAGQGVTVNADDVQVTWATSEPGACSVNAGTQGTATDQVARRDHAHDVSVGTPVAVGTSNSDGTATSLARSDHVHDHGSQSTSTHHAVATTGAAGFMSAADKTKLDGLPSGYTAGQGLALDGSELNVELDAANPGLEFTGTDPAGTLGVIWATATPSSITPDAAGSVGASYKVALEDHSHPITCGTPVSIGTGNSEGAGTGFARDNHVHDHGAQTTGTHHAAATQSVNGFMSSTDKTKLDGLPSAYVAGSGLTESPAGTFNVGAGNGIEVAADAVAVKLNATNPGLTVDANGLIAKIDATATDMASSVNKDTNGLGVAYAPRQKEGGSSSETLAIGDSVYPTGDRTYGKSTANTDAKCRVVGVAAKAYTGGSGTTNQLIQMSGYLSGLSGLTAGSPVWLQATGGYGTTLPAAGNRLIRVGIACATTAMWVAIQDFGKRAA